MKTASAHDAARALAPRAAELADSAERERRLPAELAAAFQDAGLFSMLTPRELGGLELPPLEALAAIEALATADAAAAWCVMIQSTSGVLGAYLDQDAAAEVFGPGGGVLGGVYAPLGKAITVDGGWLVSGRWPFASGSAHCNWLLGGATLESGPPRLMIFPAADVEILDTWDVSGLAGTGSNDIQVTNLRVPGPRSVALTTDRPVRGGPLYRFPVFGLLALGIAAVALGVARGAIDDLLYLAGAKTPTGSRRKLAERAMVQVDVAQAEALVGSAGALLEQTVGAAWQAAQTGAEFDLRTRAGLRLAATNATIASARAVDLMYNAGGGSSIYRTGTLQRRFRDIHAATQHVMVAPPTWEVVGRVLLGVETDTSTL